MANTLEQMESRLIRMERKGRRIYDDITKEEGKMQPRVRETAKNERKPRKIIKGGYQKLMINGKIWCGTKKQKN